MQLVAQHTSHDLCFYQWKESNEIDLPVILSIWKFIYGQWFCTAVFFLTHCRSCLNSTVSPAGNSTGRIRPRERRRGGGMEEARRKMRIAASLHQQQLTDYQRRLAHDSQSWQSLQPPSAIGLLFKILRQPVVILMLIWLSLLLLLLLLLINIIW